VSVRPDDPRCTLPASQVALLLSRGAQVEARTWADRTALHCAATNGRLGACKALVVGGAKLQARDKGGDTPVDAANCASQDVCCKAPNADWGALIALIEKVAPMAADEGAAFARRSYELLVSSRLQEAAEKGEAAELGRLLECFGRDVDARDHDGTTALHSAALGGQLESLRVLLAHGAGLGAASNVGETALHFAAREGFLDATRLLVSSGADVRATTKFHASAADLARRNQNREWEAVAAYLDAVN